MAEAGTTDFDLSCGVVRPEQMKEIHITHMHSLSHRIARQMKEDTHHK